MPEFGNTTDDLDAMLKRHRIRILVPYSKTQYFIDKGRSFGVAVEAGRQLEAELNKRYGVKRFPHQRRLCPDARATGCCPISTPGAATSPPAA